MGILSVFTGKTDFQGRITKRSQKHRLMQAQKLNTQLHHLRSTSTQITGYIESSNQGKAQEKSSKKSIN